MNTDRIEELEEKRDEFVLNESVFEDDNPSWGEVIDANNEAAGRWEMTEEGRELRYLHLLEAAENVVSRWESGNLAEAVRELAAAIAAAKGE